MNAVNKIKIRQRPLLSSPDVFPQLPHFAAEILARRGVQSEQELDLKLKYLLAPTLKGLDQAIEIIDRALD